MEGFTVVKEGVFRHDLLGLFATEEEAVSRGLEACAADVDDYHSFLVLKLDGSGETVCGRIYRNDSKKRCSVWDWEAQEYQRKLTHKHPPQYEVCR